LTPVQLVGCCLAGFLLVYMMMGVRSEGGEGQVLDWQSVNLLEHNLSKDIEAVRRKVEISQNEVEIDGSKIFYQFANPAADVAESGKTVLLLHGAAFTSQTWIDKVPTLATLAALGHRVLAVDLPGFGKSRQARVRDKGQFLSKLIRTLTNERPIVVTPSMSGSFFIPMLKNQAHRDLVSGWVPVAPVGTSQSVGFYQSISIPTLVVYGENDTGLGHRSRDDLAELPNSTKPQVLPNAGHPAYLDQPELWHQLLFNFIKLVPV